MTNQPKPTIKRIEGKDYEVIPSKINKTNPDPKPRKIEARGGNVYEIFKSKVC